MVYKLFSEGFESRIGSKAHGKVGISGIHIRSESLLARLLISFIRVLLFIYDVLSYPIYFGLQRPDLKTRTIGNQDVSAKTLCDLLKDNKSDGRKITTVNEIFARSLTKYANESCLGYRAVVTCPVLTVNEEGKHVLQEKSFRSDYTWYTYEQIGRRVQDIASGLYHYAIYPGSRALFLANACLEWFIASQACFQIAAQLVVAPEITSPTSLATIIERSNVEVIFASCDRIELLCQLFNEIKHELIGVVKMKKIILIDWQFSVDFCEPLFAKLRDSSRHMIDEILSMGHVEEMGVENPIELSCTKYLNQSASGNSSPALSRHNYNGSNSGPNSGRTTPSMGLVRASRTESLFGGPYSDSCRPLKKSTDPLSSGLHRNPKPRDLAMIVFSHGTLGKLKGVLIDHSYLAKNCLRLVAAGIVSEREVFCSILTLDNLTEFIIQLSIFSSGGSIGYSCSLNTLFYDGKDLFKRDLGDIEALRPSLMLARPYMLERLKASINDYLALQVNPLKKFLLTKVLFDYKRYWARRNFTTPIIDRLLCTETSKLFGGRMRRIMCDGLTDCSDTRDFFGQIVNIPIGEICGADEVPASLISAPDSCQLDWQRRDHLSSRPPKHGGPLGELSCFIWRVASQLMPSKRLGVSWTSDASGGASPEQPNQLLLSSPILSPTLGVSLKLEDWEDFRCDSSPLPSGRLLIGGDAVCTGYFWGSQATPDDDDSSASFEVVDSICWFRANYVARMLQNGCIEIISAISDLIKMSDGQLISLSQIEHILKNSQFVDNVCAICGDDKNFIIALVVPNLRRLALKSPGEANLKMAIGSTAHTEPEELTDVEFRREVCNDRLLCEFVSDHLGQLFSEAGLGSLPSKFHLVPEIWTPQTELVTPSFEPKRAAIQRFYAADIQSLFRMRLSRTDVRLSARLMRRSNGKVIGSSSRLLGPPTGSTSNNSRMSY